MLLITCPKGKETRAEEEAGNTLFPYDPGIHIAHTRFPGVLLVFSEKLNADRALRILRSRYQAYIRRVVPCHLVLHLHRGEGLGKLIEEVSRLVASRVPLGEPVRIDCVSRGRSLGCTELKAMLARRLRASGFPVEWRAYAWRLRIESVDEMVMAGLLEERRG